MQPDASSPSHRIARIAAHLNPQMEEGASAALRPAACRAKGSAPGFKVAILGAAGGIGQPLSMLMKMNPLVSVLHLYDVVNTPGVTADISHMDTSTVKSQARCHSCIGKDALMCLISAEKQEGCFQVAVTLESHDALMCLISAEKKGVFQSLLHKNIGSQI